MIFDGAGVSGMIFHYATIIFLVGGNLCFFLYLFKSGRLDMDEEAKYQLFDQPRPKGQCEEEEH